MSRKAAPVVTRFLPETANGLTLDEWCARFERPFIGTDVRITERKVEIITRDRRRARRKGLPESEECCSYSMHRVPPEPRPTYGWQGSFVSVEISAYWERGDDPERFARFMLRHHFGIQAPHV